MSQDDEENHFRKSKEHLERGAAELFRQSIEKGKEKGADVRNYKDYYQRNRSELIEDITTGFLGSKEPAKVGIIVLLPLLVVTYVVDWVLDKLNSIPGNEALNLTPYYLANQFIKLGFILVVSAIVVTGVGRFVRTRSGFQVEKALDYIMERIPFLGAIYNITKVTADTVFSGAEEFKQPVKVKFQGIRVTGFKTGNKSSDGRDIIFVPTAPNITSGFVIEPDPEKIEETDETVEEALTRVLSAGFGDSSSGGKPKRQEY